MGDPLRSRGQSRKERKRVSRFGGLVTDGAVSAKHIWLTDGRHLFVGWHRFSGVPLCSWVIEEWDFIAMENEIEGGVMSKFLRRLKEVLKKPQSGTAASDTEWAKLYPAITEYMTLIIDDDKKPRQPSTLYIFAEGGVWKACLGDRDNDLSLWASGETIAELLESLEALLEADSPPWRMKGKRQGKGKGKESS